MGFEPTCRLPDNTLSRRARYDHFGTSPYEDRRVSQKEARSTRAMRAKQTFDYTQFPSVVDVVRVHRGCVVEAGRRDAPRTPTAMPGIAPTLLIVRAELPQ